MFLISSLTNWKQKSLKHYMEPAVFMFTHQIKILLFTMITFLLIKFLLGSLQLFWSTANILLRYYFEKNTPAQAIRPK